MNSKKTVLFVVLVAVLLVSLAGCAQPTPEVQVVKETVVVEKEVEKVVKETVEVEVEKIVKETVEVEKEVVKEVEVTPTPVPITDEDVVTITWWGTERGRDTAAAREVHYQLARAFEEGHPNTKVAVALFPSKGFATRILTSVAAGEAPDLWYHYFAADIANQDFVEDLTPYIEASGIDPAEVWFPIGQQRGAYQDRIYGLPRDATAGVIAYNKAIFDAAGVAYPEAGWTIADYREKAIALTDAANDTYGVGAIVGSPGCFQWSSFSYNMGTDFISPDGRDVAGYMDTPEAMEALKYCLDLTATDEATAPAGMQEQYGELVFVSGQVGMQHISTWELDAINEQVDFEWAVVEPPQYDADTPGIAWTDSYIYNMWNGSEHKERTYDFMEWLTGPEAGKILAESGVWTPAVPAVWEEMGWPEDPIMGIFWTELQKETRIANYERSQFYWDCVGDIFYDVWSNYVELGETDLESYLPTMVEDAQLCLDDNFEAVEQ